MAPVVARLRHASACSPELQQRLENLGFRVEALPARSVLQVEHEPMQRPRYLVSGWACRHRHLPDGRRQVFSLVLPGEGVGVCLRPHPLANTSTTALTAVRLADASPLMQPAVFAALEDLAPALQAQADADEQQALNQIVRLGRLTALERLAHLFMELHDRLAIVGLVEGDRLPFPLTQETLADMTGLSVVHVNRTLQELRRQELAYVERGAMRLPDLDRLSDAAQCERLR